MYELYLYMYEGLKVSLIYDSTITFQHIRGVVAMQDSTLNSQFIFRR